MKKLLIVALALSFVPAFAKDEPAVKDAPAAKETPKEAPAAKPQEKEKPRRTPKPVARKPGQKAEFEAYDGGPWRPVDNRKGHLLGYQIKDAEMFGSAGRVFGKFARMLSDFPTEELDETIPDFHNMEFRLKQFNDAITENKAGRLSDVKNLVDALLARSEKMCAAEQLHRDGRLPKRICHCDTKVNNMLFDADDNSFLCVIDLDTVMPSYIFSDYGDFLRTAANTAPEDEPDISKIHFRPEIFKAFTQGYLESAKSFLTDIEIENLPYAVALFPYMQCVRFLTDYLNGDTYYKILYPEHNKVRSYAQYELFSQVEAAQEELSEVIKNLVNH